MTTTTTQPPPNNVDRVREVLCALPPDARFYVSCFDRADLEALRDAQRELREACRDRSIIQCTVLFLYDDAEVTQ